jgi:hypothetical protein
MAPDKKPRKDSSILVELDKKTVLAANSYSFILKEKIKGKNGEVILQSKYYYSELGDAVRGYAKHVMRRPSTIKRLDGTIENLITIIGKLENTIKKVGDKLNATFADRLNDPVERQLLSGTDT